MMFMAPLPKWLNLLKAVFNNVRTLHEITQTWISADELGGWFSRSTWSFVRIALWRANQAKIRDIEFWLPSYFCESSLKPLRGTGCRLRFYPVKNDLQPDYTACREMAKASPPHVFVLVHYFGCASPGAPAKDFCVRHGTWLVEDAAHVPLPCRGVGVHGDFVLYSPHKSHPLPDGALLVVRPCGPSNLGEECVQTFGPTESWSEGLEKYIDSPELALVSADKYALIWLAKRIVQKLGIWHRDHISEFRDRPSSYRVRRTLVSPVMSRLTRSLLSQGLDLASASRLRKHNQLAWDHCVSGLSELSTAPRPHQATPYLASYTLSTSGGATDSGIEAAFHSLQRLGLPLLTWPDLPQEVHDDPATHANALALRHGRVYLPVHQSLTVRKIFVRSVGIFIEPDVALDEGLTIHWDSLEPLEWQTLQRQVERSNLLQSWAWGEAKARVENWTVHRALLATNDVPIALVQVLSKRIGPLRISRVNRGPLFLRQASQAEVQVVITTLTRQLGNILVGRVFSYLPELTLSGQNLLLLAELGLRTGRAKPLESIWLDLTQTPESLRKHLHSKWRNMLSFAERHGLRLEVSSDRDEFEWLVQHCEAQMQARNGPTVPVELYRALQAELLAIDEPMLIFRAFDGDTPVAGICVVPHGSTATYLLGWNGEQGRALKANQFLLWEAIRHFQNAGFGYFDLGGIDESNLPSISEFKLGVGGERYSLAGEGWFW